MLMPVTVYTIGHSNVAFEKIAELLQKHRIEVLVDVRSAPRSRWAPWFNQLNLENVLPKKTRIDYMYLGKELGGLPDDPHFYQPNVNRKRKSDPATIVDYQKLAQQGGFQDAISKLIKVASEHKTAIMCSEEDPKNCHRSLLVGHALAKKGITVLHIRKNGELEPQPTP
jgi:uncharacterized protein (DUF488 family)